MDADRISQPHFSLDDLAFLRLIHLADSALPIGALSHSFGLESLVAAELLTAGDLPVFLRGHLQEAGMVEAVACRQAYRLFCEVSQVFSVGQWLELNETLSARKPARESRAGSASLGRNFFRAVLALGDFPVLQKAWDAVSESDSVIHHCAAFGLASAAMGFEEDRAALAYLHQMTASLISACQRLLPLGQSEATRILWHLKPEIIETANRSAACALDDVCCFMPLLDWGATAHPGLSTRLFVS